MASNNLTYVHDENFFNHDPENAEVNTKCSETLTCYNGGGCAKNGDGSGGVCYCDVSTKEGRYVGIDCSIEAPTNRSEWCNDYGDFCVNGGSCIPNMHFTTTQDPSACNCPKEYNGKYCELSVADLQEHVIEDEDKDKPIDDVCMLDCKNGGICTFGYRDPTVAELTEDFTVTAANFSINYQHCQCADGFFGTTCDTPYETCGSEKDENPQHYCHNGGTCIDIKQPNSPQSYICDCLSASDANGGKIYTGAYCEHESVNICDGNDDPNVDVRMFCGNDGKCVQERRDDNIFYTCDCTGGFSGKHCEIPGGILEELSHPWLPAYPNTPTLETCNKTVCENGAKCYAGVKDTGHTILGKLLKKHSDLEHILNASAYKSEMLASNGTGIGANEYGEHCQCPSGFTGVHCEIEFTACPEGETVCFHGSKCVRSISFLGHKCSCNDHKSGGKRTSLLAGRFCQHKATSNCGKHGCFNDGVCQDNSHCSCKEGWRGPFCQFSINARLDDDELLTQASLPENYTSKMNPNAIIFAGVMAFVGILVVIAAVVVTNFNREGMPSSSADAAPSRTANDEAMVADETNGTPATIDEKPEEMTDVELL